ncbi:MAG: hypothetical protein AB7T49_06350 [Oligoflexales bacterium]
MKLSATLLGSLLISTVGAASGLRNLPEAPANSQPRERIALDCGNVLNELEKLQQYQNDNHNHAIDFASSAAFIMRDWHNTLAPAEGKNVSVPFGYFDPLDNAANIAVDETESFTDRASLIRQDYNDIIDVLQGCID